MRASVFDEVFGRLGNKLFQYSFLYAYSRKEGIDHYFQDPKWFEDYEEEIKAMFQDGIGFLPYVSIHIRRGDYVNNPFYVDLSKTDYYQKAMRRFWGKKFLVFSDNPEFAKNYFKDNPNCQVMINETPVDDLNMMASCESNIISNSSFSWWAAYLNPNPVKTVICPKQWYTDEIERTKCPKEWFKV